MLVLLLCADEFTHYQLNTSQDFIDKISKHPDKSFTLNSDIKVDVSSLHIEKFSGILFGQNHKIQFVGDGVVFSSVESAMFNKVVLMTEEKVQLSATVLSSQFVNCTLSSVTGFVAQVQDSKFKSTILKSQGELFKTAKGTQFTGCQMLGKHFVGESVQNSFIRCYANLEKQISAAPAAEVQSLGVFASTLYLDAFLYCEMVLNISVQGAQHAALGGLAGSAQSVMVNASDFLVNMGCSGTYGDIGAVFGRVQNHTADDDLRYFSNITVEVNISAVSPAGESLAQSNIGGVAGHFNCYNSLLLGVITFNNVSASYLNSGMLLSLGGLLGQAENAKMVSACQAMGNISGSAESVIAGGITGIAKGSAEMLKSLLVKCATSVRLAVSSAYNTSIGGFTGLLGQYFNLTQCEAVGSIAVELGTGSLLAPETVAIAIGGFSGSLYTQSVMYQCITASNISVTSKSGGAISAPVVIGGLVAFLDECSIQSCVAFIDGIATPECVKTLAFGGFAGVVNKTAATIDDSYIYIDNARIQYAADFTDVCVGGAIGKSEKSFTVNYCFAQMNLTMKHAENAKIGQLAGAAVTVNVNGKAYIVVQYDSLETGHLLQLVGNIASPQISNLFVDCTVAGNSPQGTSCTQGMTSRDFLQKLGAYFVYMDKGDNNNYPAIQYTPYIDAARQMRLQPREGKPFYDYFEDSGLVFPNWNYNFCKGVCSGTFHSPVRLVCIGYTSEFCMFTDMHQAFKNSICNVQTTTEECADGLPICKQNYDFPANKLVCSLSCNSCKSGWCSDNKCLCQYSFAGGSCDKYDCQLADVPCSSQATCKLGTCLCKDYQYMFSATDLGCVMGCPNLKKGHGQCLSAGIAVCNAAYKGDQCNSCASGFSKFGEDCVTTQKYGAIVASIVIAIVLVIVLALFFFYWRSNKVKVAKVLKLNTQLTTQPAGEVDTFI